MSDISRLQCVQNSLACVIFGKSKYSHDTAILKNLHWLPVKHRIIFKQCLLVYKTIHTYNSQYFQDWFIPFTSLANTRQSNPSNLNLKVASFNCRIHKNLRHFDAAFSTCGPTLWNSLPLHVRQSKSVLCFRKGLKTYLYDLAYPK